MEDTEFYIGKERYDFFKYRYYIRVNNVTNYYYSKAGFVKKAFEIVEKNSIEELKLENMLNKLL